MTRRVPRVPTVAAGLSLAGGPQRMVGCTRDHAVLGGPWQQCPPPQFSLVPPRYSCRCQTLTGPTSGHGATQVTPSWCQQLPRPRRQGQIIIAAEPLKIAPKGGRVIFSRAPGPVPPSPAHAGASGGVRGLSRAARAPAAGAAPRRVPVVVSEFGGLGVHGPPRRGWSPPGQGTPTRGTPTRGPWLQEGTGLAATPLEMVLVAPARPRLPLRCCDWWGKPCPLRSPRCAGCGRAFASLHPPKRPHRRCSRAGGHPLAG